MSNNDNQREPYFTDQYPKMKESERIEKIAEKSHYIPREGPKEESKQLELPRAVKGGLSGDEIWKLLGKKTPFKK